MTRVLLFDIDHTLLWSGGAGSLAMNRAFKEMFGVEDGFARVEFSGRTDSYVLESGLAHHGIEGGCETHLDEFTRRYCALLPEAMGQKNGHLMPGFPQLLEALSQRPGVRLGLATGNFSETGRLKLERYGIHEFFLGASDGRLRGGFGEESLDRADVVRSAIERMAAGAAPQDVLVIGDTPHDVSSALENGVVAVGVATGTHSVEELRESGAQIVFTDFSDWEKAAAILLGHRP